MDQFYSIENEVFNGQFELHRNSQSRTNVCNITFPHLSLDTKRSNRVSSSGWKKERHKTYLCFFAHVGWDKRSQARVFDRSMRRVCSRMRNILISWAIIIETVKLFKKFTEIDNIEWPIYYNIQNLLFFSWIYIERPIDYEIVRMSNIRHRETRKNVPSKFLVELVSFHHPTYKLVIIQHTFSNSNS